MPWAQFRSPLLCFLAPACFFGWRTQLINIKLISSLRLCSPQVGSYVFLGLVSPVSHAVCNALRSLVVIIAGTVYFGTPMTPQKAFGIALVVSGGLLYAYVKSTESPATKKDHGKKDK